MDMINEVKEQLTGTIIPFWKNLRDDTYGGYYGWLGYDLRLDKKAVKGCILNSRITWFFANAYTLLGDADLLDAARHGYEFLRDQCLDRENGGIFWSVSYDGAPVDATKHTYNQAFAIYALSSYYEASKDANALALARELYQLVETRCRDGEGYLEAFDRAFIPVANDKLSENGVIADKTMNTLLHVFEAYTELYRVAGDEDVKERLKWILDIVAKKIYNPKLHRQEVFFDAHYHSILDLHSYGHDIETAWLLNRGIDVLGDEKCKKKIAPIIDDLTEQILEVAFNGHSLANECEKGIVNSHRVWWVQAEAVVGFINGYQRHPDRTDYLEAARAEWEFIKTYIIDDRAGSEWYWETYEDGRPVENRPIVEAWKCPYHNGRMCFEVIRRKVDVA